MNYELERVSKAVIMTYLKIHNQHFLGGTKENHEKSVITASLLDHNFNLGSPK